MATQVHPVSLGVMKALRPFLFVLMLTVLSAAGNAARPDEQYGKLIALFPEWRAFESSGLREGAPDYTPAAMAAKATGLKKWQARLAAIDRHEWSIAQQVDYNLVRAEMNGLDFDLRVLRPWQRDPAFYISLWTEQSDTPAHEGPVHHLPIELWQYHFPLDAAAETKLTEELRSIPPLLQQARGNLTGNARDLWTSGIISWDGQAKGLEELAEKTAMSSAELRQAVTDAANATRDFIACLESQRAKKSGPSGVGIENYNWYLRNVQLSPLTWEGEVAILKRELGRAHSALRLEEHHHRALPPLEGAGDAAEYDAKAKAAVHKFVSFLRDQEILTVRDYMEPALLAKIGHFVPPDEQNFFQIAQHRAPMALWTHFYHWFDLAHMQSDPNPSPIRRGPLLYNIWVSRAEGFATANEEMMLHAGLFDDEPRAREVVWIMQAQRAARGLASLYAQANLIDLAAAQAMQVARTPNGWMSPKLPLLGFEQGLYLRQPGYGSSYITGKYQVDKLFGEAFEARDDGYSVRQFYDELNDYGLIPLAMIRWQMLGTDDEAKAMGAENAGAGDSVRPR
ncbi:MAG: DUF885 family protein [Verrucomicrobiota bacterium]|nr:DUF885 family protein [Verrucomicrobiota bacterium]